MGALRNSCVRYEPLPHLISASESWIRRQNRMNPELLRQSFLMGRGALLRRLSPIAFSSRVTWQYERPSRTRARNHGGNEILAQRIPQVLAGSSDVVLDRNERRVPLAAPHRETPHVMRSLMRFTPEPDVHEALAFKSAPEGDMRFIIAKRRLFRPTGQEIFRFFGAIFRIIAVRLHCG